MKLTWQIVGKDFRRLRGPIALWLAVLAAKVAHGFALISGAEPGRLMKTATTTAGILTAIDVGLAVLIAALLVQEDGLSGTKAFWRTRPVSAGRLLAAKALGGFLLFGVGPILMWLPWWWHCGYGPQEVTLAAAETLMWQVAILAPTMMVAALTDSLARFFLWSIGLVAAVLTGVLLTVQVMSGRSTGAQETGVIVAGLILLAGTVALTVQQYVARGVVRSLMLAGAVIAMIVTVLAGGRWNLIEAMRHPGIAGLSDRHAEQADGVMLDLGRVGVGGKLRTKDGEERVVVETSLRLTHLPPDRFAAGMIARQTWRWADGRIVAFRGESRLNGLMGFDEARVVLKMPEGKRDEETEKWLVEAAAKRGARWNRGEGARRGEFFHAADSLARSVAERLQREPSTYEATAKFQLLKMEVWSETPLQPGAWMARAGFGLRIGGVKRSAEGDVEIARVETEPRLADRLVELTGRAPWAKRARISAVFNREGGIAQWMLGRELSSSPRVRIGTVGVRWIATGVAPQRVVRNGQWVPSEVNWLDDARVAVIGFSEVARFTRTMTVEKFLLEAETKTGR